jgi:hypothetical protein
MRCPGEGGADRKADETVTVREFHFGKPDGFRRTPSPSRSIGISDIGENLEIIYGAQQLRGKILSRKNLASVL